MKIRSNNLMKLKFSGFSKFIVYTILSIVLCNEYLIYFIQRLRWKQLHCESSCTKILFVADPQLLGYITGESRIINMFATHDSDRHLAKTFRQAVSHTKPDIIVFLGDIFDEGSISNDQEFKETYLRFQKLFPIPRDSEIIFVAGDNDIGGEGMESVKASKVHRFRQTFQEREIWRMKNKINFYNINRITHEMPLLDESDKHELEEGYYRLFLSHFTVIQNPGTFTYKSLDRFKPHVIFSGHQHRSLRIVSDLSRLRYSSSFQLLEYEYSSVHFDLKSIIENNEVLEISVPSCSYRMGSKQIGFGYGIIDHESGFLHYSVLWTISRFYQFMFYGVAFGTLLVLCIITSRYFKMFLKLLRLHLIGDIFRRIYNSYFSRKSRFLPL